MDGVLPHTPSKPAPATVPLMVAKEPKGAGDTFQLLEHFRISTQSQVPQPDWLLIPSQIPPDPTGRSNWMEYNPGAGWKQVSRIDSD